LTDEGKKGEQLDNARDSKKLDELFVILAKGKVEKA
jgi:hypothetical protein